MQLHMDYCGLAAKSTQLSTLYLFSICGLQCAELRIKTVNSAILYMHSNSLDTHGTVPYHALSEWVLRCVMSDLHSVNFT